MIQQRSEALTCDVQGQERGGPQADRRLQYLVNLHLKMIC